MALPNAPVTLTVEQVEDLNRRLSHMRHEINNHLSLIVAAAELIRLKPELMQKMSASLVEQPPKITSEMTRFSAEFEKAFGITR